MPLTLIHQFPKEKREVPEGPFLRVAEMFGDTLQGENFVGVPSTFLRLQGCTLDCVWCDTLEVWREGNPYSINEILQLWKDNGFVEKFEAGQHLILTGGSPLKQQDGLCELIEAFVKNFGFKPYIEVENETVLMPSVKFAQYVDCWNNSPKLSNSTMKERTRYKPEVIKITAALPNSWFKFVIASEQDWTEIETMFLEPGLIEKEQIVLMPEGQTRDELQKHYEIAVDMAVKHNVRFSDRMHITIWNKKVGV